MRCGSVLCVLCSVFLCVCESVCIYCWLSRALQSLYHPLAEVWLGETGSAVGGGQEGMSDRFIDGFEWLDKLGQVAAANHSLVFRQTLCGYR